MNLRRTIGLALALTAVVVGIGGASALAAANPPPTLIVQAIGKGTVTATGIDCGLGKLQCYATYSAAGTIDLTATAPTGWKFDHWTDDAASCTTNNPCLAMPLNSGNQTATAVFTTTTATSVPTNSLSVSLAGNGTVSNGSTDYPIDCSTVAVTPPAPPPPGECSLTVLQGSTLTVDEQPDTSYIFSGWGGACSGTHVNCAVYLSGDKTISANFSTATTNTLSVVVNGSGSVTGGGINCGAGSTCDAQEPPNAAITLSETPADGYAFTGWDGACSGTQSTCTVTMDTARSVTANFAQLVPVVITVNGNGTVTGAGVTCGPGPTTCTGSAPPNMSQLLTATPAAAGASVTWTGCSSASGTICRIAVGTTPVSVTVTFGTGTGPPPSVSLSVNVNGDGYVMSTSGTTSIYCTAIGGAGCTTSVPQGTTITLKAVAASGNANDFTDWGNDDCSTFTSTTCTLTMNSAKSVTADFNGTNTTYDLTASIGGSGTVSGAGLHCSFTGSAGCSSPQAAGATVTLTAQPGFGATFVGWSGACSGSTPTCNVSMSTNKNVTAQFKQAAPGKQLFTITVMGKGSVKGAAGTCTSKTGKTTTCTQQYADASKVTLTAKPATGWAFSGWKGACAGTKPTCTVEMTSALATSATFTPLPLVLTHKPKVSKISGGYRVTIFYTARASGALKVRAVLRGITIVHSRRVTKGAGTQLLTLKREGTYHVTLSLTVKGKTTKILFVVKV